MEIALVLAKVAVFVVGLCALTSLCYAFVENRMGTREGLDAAKKAAQIAFVLAIVVVGLCGFIIAFE